MDLVTEPKVRTKYTPRWRKDTLNRKSDTLRRKRDTSQPTFLGFHEQVAAIFFYITTYIGEKPRKSGPYKSNWVREKLKFTAYDPSRQWSSSRFQACIKAGRKLSKSSYGLEKVYAGVECLLKPLVPELDAKEALRQAMDLDPAMKKSGRSIKKRRPDETSSVELISGRTKRYCLSKPTYDDPGYAVSGKQALPPPKQPNESDPSLIQDSDKDKRQILNASLGSISSCDGTAHTRPNSEKNDANGVSSIAMAASLVVFKDASSGTIASGFDQKNARTINSEIHYLAQVPSGAQQDTEDTALGPYHEHRYGYSKSQPQDTANASTTETAQTQQMSLNDADQFGEWQTSLDEDCGNWPLMYLGDPDDSGNWPLFYLGGQTLWVSQRLLPP